MTGDRSLKRKTNAKPTQNAMNPRAIITRVFRQHAKAAATQPKTVKIKGAEWTAAWNGRGFTCTPPAGSGEYPIDYNTRSQAEAIRWLRHDLAN